MTVEDIIKATASAEAELDAEEAKAKAAEGADKEYYLTKTADSAFIGDYDNEEDYYNGWVRDGASPPLTSGFTYLDKQIGGGIYPGRLYVIGAETGKGKTTFILQIADALAKAGQDVLLFCIEMSRAELVAKRLSRFSFRMARKQLDGEGVGDSKEREAKVRAMALTATQIMRGGRSYVNEALGDINTRQETIRKAIARYREFSDRIRTVEGGMVGGKSITVESIDAAVNKHVEKTGKTPIVFVDYLQILESESNKSRTDKQLVDYSIKALKRISKEYNTPVFVVSSLNRESYKGDRKDSPIELTDFKETGSVEYSCDLLMGLQSTFTFKAGGDGKEVPEPIKYDEDNQIAHTTVKILKNRWARAKDANGKHKTVRLQFKTWYNNFDEDSNQE